MKEIIITLIVVTLIISCYYINKKLLIKINKEEYSWNHVNNNLVISLLIIPSIIYWLIYMVTITPPLPEKPPRWL
jgi:TRAP-type C4-dicarboxylate transport system permease large subunit